MCTLLAWPVHAWLVQWWENAFKAIVNPKPLAGLGMKTGHGRSGPTPPPSLTSTPMPTGVRGAEAAVRRCLLLRAEMCHFATNLQYYLMFEVLEASRQVSLAWLGWE